MRHFYDFVCKSGHVHEAFIEPDEIDVPCPCPFASCGELAHQVWLTSPGMHGFESRTAVMDRMIYGEHNITHEGGTPEVRFKPNSPTDQCQCGNCSAHRHRNAVTGVADKGKEISLT